MWAFLTTGLAIGMLGSFHCVGMCGPLALSLPIYSDRVPVKFLGTFIYNAGRVFTYALLGAGFGLLGRSVAIFGFQQWLSIGLGAVILLFLLTRNRHRHLLPTPAWLDRFFALLRNGLGVLYSRKGFLSLFLIGVLNGLLPCGLVYMALAGAVATGSVLNSAVFMAGFGLGTLPVMWAVAFFGHFITMGIRVRMRKVYPYVMALMACLLIVRGLGLGIPYLSPKAGGTDKTAIECVHNN